MSTVSPNGFPLGLGELVVYAGHGIGRVTALPGPVRDDSDVVVLEFADGLRVTLPLARAREALRSVSGEAELALVADALGASESPEEPSWSRRLRTVREQVARGEVLALAEVVRDGICRERRLSAAGKPTSGWALRDLYLQARRLLANEVSIARKIELAVADDWITDQVVAVSTETTAPSRRAGARVGALRADGTLPS